MMTIPLQVNSGEYDLVIILEDENIERLKGYDPGEVDISKLGPFSNLRVRRIQIAYANPEEVKLIGLCNTRGQLAETLNNLSRGWKFRPELGDSDMAYQSPGKN